ncbi:MAG: DUF6356 family protein [Pseudomonadota bacterium]
MKSIVGLFTHHPTSVDETYLEHMRFAGGAGLRMVAAGCAALVHAVLPFMFEHTASRLMAPIAQKLVARNSELASRAASQLSDAA